MTARVCAAVGIGVDVPLLFGGQPVTVIKFVAFVTLKAISASICCPLLMCRNCRVCS